MRWRGVRAGWAGRTVRAAAALLLCALLPRMRLPLHAHLAADFQHLSPDALAHFLADFSNYPKLYPDIGAWAVEEEAGNYTWWRYAVSYECGARCEGRAHVRHAAPRGPRRAHAHAHLLHLADRRCTHLPLLPWPTLCEETEIEMSIEERAGGGAQLTESARGACGAAELLAARCGLRARRHAHLQALRRALPP